MAPVIRIAITFLVSVLQIMHESNSPSPLDTNPNMLISISTFLLYCFACYLKHNLTSFFRSSTWPALLIYTNFMTFLGFVSMASFITIIFSTSFAASVFVYLLLALFFSANSVLSLIRHENSFSLRRSNSSSNLQVRIDLPRIQAFSSDVRTLPV